MRSKRWIGGALLMVVALVTAGCGPAKDKDSGTGSGTGPKKHDHSGWWCDEHGVPEHKCSLCLPADKVKTMFKDKDDWCKEHDRAKSQCFKCDPKLYEKFEAEYVARYGEKPKRPPEEEFKK